MASSKFPSKWPPQNTPLKIAPSKSSHFKIPHLKMPLPQNAPTSKCPLKMPPPQNTTFGLAEYFFAFVSSAYGYVL